MEITMTLNEDVLSALRRSPSEFARDMRLYKQRDLGFLVYNAYAELTI